MRYRSIDVRLWGDKKFRSLSHLEPSGQALFLYLLTNPNTTSIPGLYRAGAAAMAEELGWPIEGFRKVFDELIQQGLIKADLGSRVIFIPNAVKYNKPQSPNVVKSWASHLDEIPECELKNIAYDTLKLFVESMGEAFLEAFPMVTGKVVIKAMPNQEQEQEQNQEKKDIEAEASLPSPTNPVMRVNESMQSPKTTETQQIFEHWKLIMNHPNAKFDSKRQKAINLALKLGFSINELKQAIEGCAKTPFNMGKNENKQEYNSLSVILKSADQIERFIKNATINETISPKDNFFDGAL